MATLYKFGLVKAATITFDSWYALLYTVAMFLGQEKTAFGMSSPSPALKPDICNFISLVMFVEQNTLAKKLCPCIRGRLIDCVDTAIYHAKKGKSWQTLFETKCFPLPTHFDMPRMESNAVGLYGNTVYCQNQTSLYINSKYLIFKERLVVLRGHFMTL